MSAPRDGMPLNLPAELADNLERISKGMDMLLVRRRPCGCRLGRVRRVAGIGDVLDHEERVFVRVTPTENQARWQKTLLLLDNPHVPVLGLRCKHGGVRDQDEQLIALLRMRVAEVAAGDTPRPLKLLLT